MEDVELAITLPSNPPVSDGKSESGKKERRYLKIPFPVELEAQQVNVTVSQGEEYLKIREMQFGFQAYASGPLLIKELVIHHRDWEKKFTQVYGGISLQDEKICATDLLLQPGLTIDSLAVFLPELDAGKLKSEFASRAFSGTIRGEILSAGRDKGHLNFDASGSFSKIAIGQLVAFLRADETATGTIKEGKFSFHGSPRNLPKATISTRLEASDFKWRDRQWNSLVIGASLFERRLQIPEFELKQAHNSLSLKGEMTLPGTSKQWQKAALAFNLKAKLDNITELSSLLGPDIGEAAGQATVEGNITGQNGSFNGQFIIAGTNLSYRSAPLDALNAALTLRDNEIEISHAEFAHKDDYLRAHGVVTLSGQRRYTGDIKASVADLSLYASILQPPIAPYPFSGSLLLDWSGDGSANSHSGAFRARLKDVRPLSPDAATPDYRILADMDATYAPEHLYFSKLIVGDPDDNFSGKVTADPNSIKLEDVIVQQKGSIRMVGEARLPLNIWKAWQRPSAKEVWDVTVPCTVNLAFKKLDLHETAAIFGREFPVRGDLQGELTTSGSINALDIQGRLTLSRGELPLSAAGGADLRNIESVAVLSGNMIRLEKFSAQMRENEEFALEGTVDAGDLQNPGFNLVFRSKALAVKPRGDLAATAALDLNIDGSLTGASVTGVARLSRLVLEQPLSLEELFFGQQKLNNLVTFDIFPEMTKQWNVDVRLTGSAAARLLGAEGRVEPGARLVGSPSAAHVTGLFDFDGFTLASPGATFQIQHGSVFLGGQSGAEPSLLICGKGMVEGKPFSATLLGSPEEKTLEFTVIPPMEEAEFRKAISREPSSAGAFSSVPRELSLTDLPQKSGSLPLEALESLGLETQMSEGPLPNLPPLN